MNKVFKLFQFNKISIINEHNNNNNTTCENL